MENGSGGANRLSQHWLLAPKSLSSPKGCYKVTSVHHLQAKSLTEWDRILGIQAFQKCLYHGVKHGDELKKKKKKTVLIPRKLAGEKSAQTH